jgi:nicotinamidase-related amidase
MAPKTLLEMAGAAPAPPRLAEAALVVIDAQHEYVDGALPLAGIGAALEEIARLIARARAEGAAIVHVRHRGRPGGAFDPTARRGEIVAAAAPQGSETVVEKALPNAFASTSLKSVLDATGRRDLVLAGFMTHMCVEATARGAVDLGFRAAVVAAATATRDLPDPLGGAPIAAAEVQRNALAALADRFATIVRSANDLPA